MQRRAGYSPFAAFTAHVGKVTGLVEVCAPGEAPVLLVETEEGRSFWLDQQGNVTPAREATA